MMCLKISCKRQSVCTQALWRRCHNQAKVANACSLLTVSRKRNYLIISYLYYICLYCLLFIRKQRKVSLKFHFLRGLLIETNTANGKHSPVHSDGGGCPRTS